MNRHFAESPFPGMDPYLEDGGRWRGFHVSFLTHLMGALNEKLPETYTADLEEAVELVELDAPSFRESIPDGTVSREPGPPTATRARGGTGATGTLEPVVLAHPPAEEVKHRWIEIRTAPERELVAVIELLSPTNKRSGRADYLAKRRSLMAQPIHLIEVDLLLEGPRLPMSQPLPPGDYFALVSRADRRPMAEVYPWTVRQPLPAIPVPLRSPDPDHLVALQPVFAQTYHSNAYGRKLDYGRPLKVKLPAAALAWATGLVGGSGEPS